MARHAWPRLAAFWGWLQRSTSFRPTDNAPVDNVEPPLRETLFSATQLASHARSLGAAQTLSDRPGPELLLHRLAENEEVIAQS